MSLRSGGQTLWSQALDQFLTPSGNIWDNATLINTFLKKYINFRPHERVSSSLEPCPSNIWDMRRVLYFEKLLFLGIRGLHSLMLTFKLTQANYFQIATKCRADGTKKSSRRPVFPVKSTVSKEEERNYQWKREKIAPSSVRVELKNLFSEEKIDKLERDCKRLQCESAGLKRTIQTLRRSIGKCLLKYSSSRF